MNFIDFYAMGTGELSKYILCTAFILPPDGGVMDIV